MPADAQTLLELRVAAGPHSDVQPPHLRYHIGELLKERDELVRRFDGLPAVVCLCGSTRFRETFEEVARQETVAGRIVLTVNEFGNDGHPEKAHLRPVAPEEKARLDELHLRKIDLADEVLILNVGGYIGESTRRELAYAREHGKVVRFLEPAVGEGTR